MPQQELKVPRKPKTCESRLLKSVMSPTLRFGVEGDKDTSYQPSVNQDTWMCTSSGTGRTLGLKLYNPTSSIPSQFAKSLHV